MNRQKVIRIFACLAVALLALKFGCYIGNGEQANFPMDGWEWFFFTGWPTYLASAIGGFVLLMAAVAYPKPRGGSSTIPPLLWCLPLVIGFIGCINTTETDYAGQWMLHFLGAFALSTGIWWISCNDDRMLPALSHIIAIVGLLLVCHGWYQHFIGLEASREYALQHAAEQGLNMTGVVLAKMEQTRIYSFFIDPNVYASFLVLTMPFALYGLYQFGCCYEGNPKAGAITATSIGAILYLCAIVWTGSRGGILALAAAIAASIWALPQLQQWKWRWALPVVAILLFTALLTAICFIKSRDGLASASARLIYYQTSLEIFKEHPVAGAGLGEFLSAYMRLKPVEAEIARDPHNIFFSFLVQAGLLGGLVALALFLFPWCVATFAKTRRTPLFIAAVAATAGWFFHCMMQFNEIIPACAYTASASCLFLLPSSQEEKTASPKWRIVAVVVSVLCFASLLRVPGEHLLRQAELVAAKSPSDAIPLYRQCSAKLPAYAAPQKMLYDIIAASGNWEGAYQEAMHLQKTIPTRSTSYLYATAAALATGKLDDAEAQLVAAESRSPTAPEVFIYKAVLAYRRIHSLGYMENAILARQTKWCHADIGDKGDHLEILFDLANHEMLANAVTSVAVTVADGRPVHFIPRSNAQEPAK
ncbi:MAG: O-antigen ligase family protein [Victivallales bacterium]|nr:O-antigen ligase family protein [Victivallales bacterium]